MLDYMKNNYGNRVGVNEASKQELDFLKSEVPKLRTFIKAKTNKAYKSTASG